MWHLSGWHLIKSSDCRFAHCDEHSWSECKEESENVTNLCKSPERRWHAQCVEAKTIQHYYFHVIRFSSFHHHPRSLTCPKMSNKFISQEPMYYTHFEIQDAAGVHCCFSCYNTNALGGYNPITLWSHLFFVFKEAEKRIFECTMTTNQWQEEIIKTVVAHLAHNP